MTLEQVTPPEIEPISLASLKDWLRVSNNDEDQTIDDVLNTARDRVEKLTGRQLINSVYQLRLRRFETWIRIPRPPLVSVDLIQYLDGDGNLQTLAASEYQVINDKEEAAVITNAFGTSYPATRDAPDAVRIDFTAGYGATADGVPEALRTAVRILAAHYYEERQPVVVGTVASKIPESFNALLAPYKAFTVI